MDREKDDREDTGGLLKPSTVKINLPIFVGSKKDDPSLFHK